MGNFWEKILEKHLGQRGIEPSTKNLINYLLGGDLTGALIDFGDIMDYEPNDRKYSNNPLARIRAVVKEKIENKAEDILPHPQYWREYLSSPKMVEDIAVPIYEGPNMAIPRDKTGRATGPVVDVPDLNRIGWDEYQNPYHKEVYYSSDAGKPLKVVQPVSKETILGENATKELADQFAVDYLSDNQKAVADQLPYLNRRVMTGKESTISGEHPMSKVIGSGTVSSGGINKKYPANDVRRFSRPFIPGERNKWSPTIDWFMEKTEPEDPFHYSFFGDKTPETAYFDAATWSNPKPEVRPSIKAIIADRPYRATYLNAVDNPYYWENLLKGGLKTIGQFVKPTAADAPLFIASLLAENELSKRQEQTDEMKKAVKEAEKYGIRDKEDWAKRKVESQGGTATTSESERFFKALNDMNNKLRTNPMTGMYVTPQSSTYVQPLPFVR